MGTQAPLLRLEGLSKQYPSTEGATPLYILKEVTLDIAQGEAVAIIGPSGSGKSTLLNVLGTLDKPTSGKVTFAGRDVTQLDELALAALRNREIGFIFQSHHLLPQCTVLENVLVPTLATDSKRGPETVERAKRLLERVGLGQRLSHQPGQLSGGERQRVAVVRALINQPKLVLADEPTGALDRVSADNLAQLLVDLNKEDGVTLIVVTHAQDLAKKMNRILELQDGKLVEKKS